MYHANAMTMVSSDHALERLWQRAQTLASKGAFSGLQFVERPGATASAASAFNSVDGQENRLVVLDPRRWTLLNGKDTATRDDIDVAFALTGGLTATYAASMVVALVNTQRRARARDRARDVLAWEGVVAQLDPDNEEYSEACARRDEARRRFDADVKWAYQHYAYLLRTSSGLSVQYKAIPDGKSSLNGQEVWTELVSAGRAVAAGNLSPEYIAQLITSGAFGRDLTPKELFALPFSNPTWPLVATVEDLRRVVFQLATGSDWMLADSDGDEVRPTNPGQIQPSSMQQQLRARMPMPSATLTPDVTAVTTAGSAQTGMLLGSGTLDGEPRQVNTDQGSHSSTSATEASAEVGYEITKIRLPSASVTDDTRREAIWVLLREIASVADPARRDIDLQMMGLEITITARKGDAEGVKSKAGSVPGAKVTVEDDEF